MKNSLDTYVNRIIQNTLKVISVHPAPEQIPADQQNQSYRLLSDDDLDEMIGVPGMDILINAHVPEFDKNTFPHKHTFYELIYVHHGIFRMTIDRRTRMFHEGDFILLNPSVIHCVSLGSPDSQIINILMKRTLFNRSFFHVILDNPGFASFFLPSLSKNTNEKNYRIYPHVAADNPVILDYLSNLLREFLEGQTLNKSALEINLSGLCLELTRSHQKTPSVPFTKKSGDFSMADICQYLSANLCDATLENTASRFHYNPRYFSQMIKKIYGKSFSGLLLELKMNHAVHLLTTTDLPVTEIIHQCGYENTSYFYQAFEKAFQMKPALYREKYRACQKSCHVIY